MSHLDDLKILARTLRWLPDLLHARPGGHFTAADLVERCARHHADRVFVEVEGRSLSYAAFDRAANRVAHWALARGFGRGDVVALMMENRPEFPVAWAGLAKAGVTTALINTQLSGYALEHVIAAADCRAIVLGQECLDAFLALPTERRGRQGVFACRDPDLPVVTLPTDVIDLDAELEGLPDTDPPRGVRDALRSEDPLFYIYTSGTTGLPKAARFSHARFLAGGSYHLLSGFGRDDALYCALPLYHTVGGVICVNAAMLAGARLVLRRGFSASRFWQDVTVSGATTFQYIGEMCRYLLAQPPGEWDRRHRVRYAVGNGLRPDIWEAFTARFGIARMVEFYGATESNVTLVNLQGRPGSLGRPMPGITAALVRYDIDRGEHLRDAAGLCVECAPGETGELLGRIGDGSEAARFEGYTSAEATRQKILHDVRAPGDSWFRSGDLLRHDREGFYYFVDRIGDSFRWKGENVSTQEVEELLSAFPGVGMAIVYGVAVPGHEGRAGMAALAADGDLEPASAAFFRHVAQLPAYARPVFLRRVERVEMTGTFKVRKVDLQRQGFDPAACGGTVYLRDDAQATYRPLEAADIEAIRSGRLRL